MSQYNPDTPYDNTPTTPPATGEAHMHHQPQQPQQTQGRTWPGPHQGGTLLLTQAPPPNPVQQIAESLAALPATTGTATNTADHPLWLHGS